jgi:hypothetical protein
VQPFRYMYILGDSGCKRERERERGGANGSSNVARQGGYFAQKEAAEVAHLANRTGAWPTAQLMIHVEE